MNPQYDVCVTEYRSHPDEDFLSQIPEAFASVRAARRQVYFFGIFSAACVFFLSLMTK